MSPIDRRNALRAGAIAGIAAATTAVPNLAHADEETATPDGGHPPVHWTPGELEDRERVLEVGFTEREADCWLYIARATGAFFDLEELHPSDLAEVAEAVHIIQNKLLSRPTYKAYLELAGAYPPQG